MKKLALLLVSCICFSGVAFGAPNTWTHVHLKDKKKIVNFKKRGKYQLFEKMHWESEDKDEFAVTNAIDDRIPAAISFDIVASRDGSEMKKLHAHFSFYIKYHPPKDPKVVLAHVYKDDTLTKAHFQYDLSGTNIFIRRYDSSFFRQFRI